MVTNRAFAIVLVAAAAAALLAYLRDPPWLIDQTSGLRRWEQPAGEPRYRWSTGHASFFVPAAAGAIDIPVSTTFDAGDDRPMLVSVSVDGNLAARTILVDSSWTRIHLDLPPPGSRRVRRIDVRTNVTREGNRGVRIAEPELPPKVAGKLLRTAAGGETS